ncbi:vasculin-like protein 1 isoform X1 [Erpetoichthys calabaricus]|uniref:GC-rich promoter binding protein 1 like 1 n=1 Tax=Erpetoichthys calabaricus TaxID=27687 RepID=A0A8C4TJA1_ERPCA|nr:vasculin-like protein 1 isoform X1 [Erpetoichthys calabaricus]
MAQHDFVPAWLNFSTPRPVKSPAVSLEKHGEHVSRGDGRQAVNRRRHNSSDGFFNNGPLRAPGVDVWQQPSLLRHDSVDSGVSKGPHVGLVSSQGWKENNSSWHSTAREPMNQHHRSGGERLASHRQWNGNVHPRKSAVFQEKPPPEAREEKRDIKEDKLKFMEEDFPSLNPEAGNQISHNKPMGTPAGVWENPPSAKQTVSKMLVIKKVSKEDPSAAFSAGFAVTQPILANGNKIPIAGPSVYKNLVPKVTAPSAKAGPWKPNGRESKSSLHFSGRDTTLTSPVTVTKPLAQISNSSHVSPKEQTPPGNSSTTPPVDINPPRLVKLMRRSDKKSEFLKTLKDDQNGDASACHSPTAQEEGESSTPEPKDYGEGICYQNGLSLSAIDSDSEHLSSSLEAEHRLLKAMGWQEHPENDENYLPLTEDELKEFQAKTEQLKKNSSGQSSSLLKPRSLHLGPWRSTLKTEMDEGSESETSSSETSDDDT